MNNTTLLCLYVVYNPYIYHNRGKASGLNYKTYLSYSSFFSSNNNYILSLFSPYLRLTLFLFLVLSRITILSGYCSKILSQHGHLILKCSIVFTFSVTILRRERVSFGGYDTTRDSYFHPSLRTAWYSLVIAVLPAIIDSLFAWSFDYQSITCLISCSNGLYSLSLMIW